VAEGACKARYLQAYPARYATKKVDGGGGALLSGLAAWREWSGSR
jgi:hypothetical protein